MPLLPEVMLIHWGSRVLADQGHPEPAVTLMEPLPAELLKLWLRGGVICGDAHVCFTPVDIIDQLNTSVEFGDKAPSGEGFLMTSIEMLPTLEPSNAGSKTTLT